jgi:uncharacterized protein YciI
VPYLIETFDRPGAGALRLAVRDEHLAYLDSRMKLLLACGAKLDDDWEAASGGIYLLDVATRTEAEAFIAADPFSKAGLFREVTICRWRKAYLDGRKML